MSSGGQPEMPRFRVLQLVTTPRSFFRQQVRTLEDHGVECVTLSVPNDVGDRGVAEYLSFYAKTVRRALGPFDVVHANYGLVGPVALSQPRRPVVLTLWGSDLMTDGGWLPRLSRAAARRADAVVVPSEAMSRELSCPHRVVPFGVDTEQFRPIDRATAREHLGWSRDERVVLFPYDPERTVKNYPRARRIVDRLPFDATLRTVTGVAHEEMPYYLNASDALLVTSDRESGPMVVREAVACEVPVVSTDVGFVSDALAGVENTAVCETENELVAELAGILETEDVRATGRTDVPGLDETARQLLDVYEAVT